SPVQYSFNVDATAAPSPLGTIAFLCSGLPRGALCNFSPPSENQDYAAITLTVGTTARPAVASVAPFGFGDQRPMYAILFPMLGLAGIVVLPGRRRSSSQGKGRRKGVWVRLVLGLGGMFVLLALAGCGGRPQHDGFTPPGTYTITVTAAAGSTTANTTVTLTVQ
ncbi:MAG TPA: hypothetical protein VKE98_08285, partial [Gemmataceae bacterium]|nr:hypothetical protein [Gemmataceae bacterium]